MPNMCSLHGLLSSNWTRLASISHAVCSQPGDLPTLVDFLHDGVVLSLRSLIVM